MEDKPYIVLTEAYGNPPPELNAFQLLLEPHVETLTNAWISVWIVTAITLLTILVRQYREWKQTNK